MRARRRRETGVAGSQSRAAVVARAGSTS